jgi:hypothetical protein
VANVWDVLYYLLLLFLSLEAVGQRCRWRCSDRCLVKRRHHVEDELLPLAALRSTLVGWAGAGVSRCTLDARPD